MVVERLNAEMATAAALTQGAIASAMSKEGAKAFTKTIKSFMPEE